MSKNSNSQNDHGLKPVKQVEVSEKNVGFRIALFIVFIVLAVVSVFMFIQGMGEQDKGWRPIAINATGEANCADEFKFYYDLGRNGKNPTTEYNSLKELYTKSSIAAYRIFSADEQFDGVYNMALVNANVNHDTVVESSLYQALTLMQETQNRFAYFAPLYDALEPIYLAASDEQAKTYDPEYSQEMQTYFAEILPYAQSAQHVWVECKPQNTVCLHVSEEYLAVSARLGFSKFVDFAWLKNAFVADYLASEFISSGYVDGYLSSVDGFTRVLGGEVSTSCNAFSKIDNELFFAATLDISKMASVVQFKSYKTSIYDRLYVYQDGRVIAPFLDLQGNTAAAVPSLLAYSYKNNCAKTALLASQAYVNDTLLQEQIIGFTEQNVHFIWCEQMQVCYTESSLLFTAMGKVEQEPFTTKYIH